MYEHISDFLANWLNEEWRIDYGNWQDALEAYVRRTPSRREALLAEFGTYLLAKPDDRVMTELLHARQAMLYPHMESGSYLAWVTEARTVVEEIPSDGGPPSLVNLVEVLEARKRTNPSFSWQAEIRTYVAAMPQDQHALTEQIACLQDGRIKDSRLLNRLLRVIGPGATTDALDKLSGAIESIRLP